MPHGLVFDIQRFSLHDGPGLRTLVFLKGCPLQCWWCSNPESQSSHREILFDPQRCTGCGTCAAVCPSGAVFRDAHGRAVYRRELCAGCGLCADACPNQARRLVGSWTTVAEVMEEVQRDLPFFRRSGGGVTLGGGEPLFQAQFASEILEACRHQGINTALETCGYAPWQAVRDLCRRADHVLFDVKHIDPEEHERLTGVDNTRILANLEDLARIHPDVVVRYPLIPDLNDSDAQVTRLARFLRGLKGVRRIEVLPYHRYGERKYEMLGRSYPLAGTAIPSASEVQHVCELLLAEGLECSGVAA